MPVRRSGLDGESLPFADDSFYAALSTWTMCSIPDIERALAELLRVLKPGGALHFLEHGLAPDEPVQRSAGRKVCQRRHRRLSGRTRYSQLQWKPSSESSTWS